MNQELMGKFISQERKNKKLTQEQLAEKLKVDRTVVSRWERGVSAPDIDYIKKLSNIFNLTVEELIECRRNNNEDVDSKVKTAIDYYEKRYFRRILSVIIGLFLLISVIFVTVYIINSRTYFVMDEINIGKDDFEIHGYFISNEEKSYLLINDILFVDMYVGTVDELKISEVEIILQNDKEQLMKKIVEIEDDQPNEISKVFSELRLSYESKQNKLEKSNLLLIINYKDIDGILKTTKIFLKE